MLLATASRCARAAAKAAGLPEPKEIKGGPHKARHTFASFFLASRPDLFLLGEILGHSHTKVTELYSHLLPDHLERGRDVVSFEAMPLVEAAE